MDLTKRSAHWILLAIVLLGLALRVWGIDFALPNLARPDENHISQSVVYNLVGSFLGGSPQLNPHFFYYPSLFLYLLSLVYSAFFIIGYWLGWFADGQAFMSLYQTDWSSFHLLQRLLSASFGVASIPAVYALGRQISGNRTVAVVSAFLLAIAYLHVRDSHFGMTDIASVFWIILCLYHSVRYAQLGKHGDLYKASVLAGLAATTKYPAGFVLASVYTVYALRCRLQSRSWQDALNRMASCPSCFIPIVVIALVFAGVSFLGTPFSLLDPAGFLTNLSEQGDTVNSDLYGYMLPGWLYHVQFSLWYGLGAFYAVTGFAGLLWRVYRKQDFSASIPHWGILVFCGVYYIANAFTHYVFARYAMPFVPVLAVYAAYVIVTLACNLSKQNRFQFLGTARFRYATILILSLVLLSYQSLARSVQIDAVLNRPDTRSQARDWLMARLNPGEGVGIGMVFTHVDLPPMYPRYFLRPLNDGYDYERHQMHYYYSPKATLLDVSTNRNEYNVSTYSDVAFLREKKIRYVVLGVVTQPMYRMPDFEIEAVRRQSGLKKVATFRAFPKGETPLPWQAYDAIDGFFVPYTEPGAIEHAGPSIEIYEVQPETK